MSSRVVVASGIGKRNATIQLLADECALRGVDLLGCDASPLASARSGVSMFAELPLASDPEFRSAYTRVLAEHNVAACLTLIDPELALLADMEASGVLGTTALLHPPASTIRVCEDKFAFYESMQSSGLPAIPTYLLPPKTFPYIRKDRRGSRGSGFSVLQVAETPADGNGDLDTQVVYQPFCEGPHYCVDAYYSVYSSNLVDLSAKQVLAKQDGESYLLRSVERDPFVTLLQEIGEALPLRGIVNLDIYQDGDHLSVMEINCRVGGNYPAAHAVGSNLLRHALREVLEGTEAVPDFSDYEVGRYVSKFIGFSTPYDRP